MWITSLTAEMQLPLLISKQVKMITHHDVVCNITSEFTSKKESWVCCPHLRVQHVLSANGVAMPCIAYFNVFLNKISLFFLSVGYLISYLFSHSGHMHLCLDILFFKNILLFLWENLLTCPFVLNAAGEFVSHSLSLCWVWKLKIVSVTFPVFWMEKRCFLESKVHKWLVKV